MVKELKTNMGIYFFILKKKFLTNILKNTTLTFALIV